MAQVELQGPRVWKAALIGGWILTLLPVLALLASGTFTLLKPQPEQMQKAGWPPDYAMGLGILQIVCAVVTVIPQTAVLGAILMTGYFGGAVATHVRLGQLGETAPAIILGVLLWLGLYLRDRRVRGLAPIRTRS
jgi:DoxX-like family